jgi:biopolymer transport protein ExbD
MSRRKKFTEEVEDINLVPIMNLVLCLIPAVLFNTQLVKIGMIDVNAPQIAPPSPKPPKDEPEKPLGLTLLIDSKGFLLSAKGADLSAPEALGEGDQNGVRIGLVNDKDYKASDGKNAKSSLPRGMSYDYVSLYNKLKVLRGKYPDKKEKPPEVMTISAESTVEFKYIIRSMDVARYEFTKDVKKPDDFIVGSEANSYVTEKKDKKTVYKALWAYVTFAMSTSGNAK